MQYVFSKKVYTVYNGVWGKATESWGIFEKMGEQNVLVAPPIIFPCSPG